MEQDKIQKDEAVKKLIDTCRIKNMDLVSTFYAQSEYMTTGIPYIDDQIKGLTKGEFVLLAAGTNVGKTVMLEAFCLRAAKAGKKCLYVPVCEDSQDTIALHFIRYLNNMSKKDFTKENISKDTIINTQADETLENILIYQVNTMEGYKQLPDIIKMFINYEHVEYIFIDYIGSVSDPSNQREYAFLKMEANSYQQIARNENVCLIAAAQLKQALYDYPKEDLLKTGVPRNFVENSYGIVEKANTMLGMFELIDEQSETIKGKPRKKQVKKLYIGICKSKHSTSNKPVEININYNNLIVKQVSDILFFDKMPDED